MLVNQTNQPKVVQIADGWAVYGKGWAVHATTKNDALRKFEDRVKFYQELLTRRPFREVRRSKSVNE